MRKIFALILIALLVGVGVVAVIETDPGYLLVAYRNYTVESSLWVGLLLIALLALSFYLLIGLAHRLAGGRQSLQGWLGGRRARQASSLTARGQISLIEGNWATARRQLLQGARHNDAPLLNYLMAAQASDRLGEPDKIQEYLWAAADAESGAALAVDITRAEMKLRAGEYEEVVALLRGVPRSAGRNPHVLDMLRRAYLGLEDWGSLADMLPELKKHSVIPPEEHKSLQRQVYTQMLDQSGDQEEGAALDGLRKRWQKLPADMKQDPAMVRRYVGLLIDHKAYAVAEKLIVRSLKQHWDSGLVRLFAYVESDSVSRQLTQAESWLSGHPEDAQLLLCLGRLSARDKLWGKARDYFESSYRLERSAETCAEMGRLLNGLGEPKVAGAYFREGLLMQENRLPELPMPDKMVPDSHRLARS